MAVPAVALAAALTPNWVVEGPLLLVASNGNWSPFASCQDPTATQCDESAQDTAESSTVFESAGSSPEVAVHAEPDSVSTSACWLKPTS